MRNRKYLPTCTQCSKDTKVQCRRDKLWCDECREKIKYDVLIVKDKYDLEKYIMYNHIKSKVYVMYFELIKRLKYEVEKDKVQVWYTVLKETNKYDGRKD